MAVSSITTTKRWQCVAPRDGGGTCGTIFDDPTSSQPCPACGNADDNTIEPYAPSGAAAVGTTKKAPKAKAEAAPSYRGWLGIHWDRAPIVLLGLLILGLWWMTGGRYTIDGLPLVFNEVAAFMRLPTRLAPVTNGAWYAALCWLPFLISVSERKHSPWTRLVGALKKARQGHQLTIGDILGIVFGTLIAWVTLIWLIVSALDALSTWLAVTHPPSDAYTISKQLAALWPLAGLWTAATTFLPEMGIVALWRWLRE